MVKATEYDANTTWGDGGNSEYRGYSAALYAFKNGEYDAAIKLCDKLLPVKINGDFAKRYLRDLKAASEKMAKGEKGEPDAHERPSELTSLSRGSLTSCLNILETIRSNHDSADSLQIPEISDDKG